MTDELQALARRWVECRPPDWRKGMSVVGIGADGESEFSGVVCAVGIYREGRGVDWLQVFVDDTEDVTIHTIYPGDGEGETPDAVDSHLFEVRLLPDLTDRATICVIQGMVEAEADRLGIAWKWVATKREVEFWKMGHTVYTQACIHGPDLATVAASAWLWTMAQEEVR